jgi:hypothetical protein
MGYSSPGVQNTYLDGSYLEFTGTWHSEDSPFKAAEVVKILRRNKVQFRRAAEIGCGAGLVLKLVSDQFQDAEFFGYDISPQAIAIARTHSDHRLTFVQADPLDSADRFDLLMAIDVFEHVPDYMGFLERCSVKAEWKLYHVPLDLHVSALLRDSYVCGKTGLGHLHYFTASAALRTLKDTGHEIVDYAYTNAAMGLFWQHPTLKRAVANVPRWILSKVNLPFASRLLGGWELMVLCR